MSHHTPLSSLPCLRLSGVTLLAAAVVGGCAHAPSPEGPPVTEVVWALTADHTLLRIQAGQPQHVQKSLALKGLPAGEQLVGMDFRVAKGVLFALGRTGQLYTLNTETGQLQPVGQSLQAVALTGARWGVDFNPAADRIRVVSDSGHNLRYHPDTGAVVDFDAQQPGVQADPSLRFAAGDTQFGQPPRVVAAAYTYNTRDEKITTNFAIDARLGTLVMQGSREGVTPVESPNLGVLRTVGTLGVGPLVDAAFDIADVKNTALAALRTQADPVTRLYRIDLLTGQARPLGALAAGQPVVGLAIEP